ncbi:hypothetical protein Ga0100231_024525 [Opitutaceae bacterium TAV4]|nr:hypothetical protein Ga0100231_024525 [Opitutaceae bacterium TAV4]RRK00863.1 hypothetical protein Ga0100230_024090 [Opitutaceae bacterium TAV3]
MNSVSLLSPSEHAVSSVTYDRPGHAFCSVSWAAILAGLIAAIALQVLFMLLGAGLGFAIYSPLTDESPVVSFGAGALIVQGLSAVVSLWFGGWVAGRFTPAGVRGTAWLHGFIVWSAATVAGVLFVSAGAGWALGDLSKIVGGGLSLAGQPAAALAGGAADMARDAIRQSDNTFASFTDEAVGSRPAGETGNTSIRAKREVGMAVARFFSPMQEENRDVNRTALVKVLVDEAGLSEAAANKAVADWTATYERLKADLTAVKEAAEVKAREAAEAGARTLAILSFGYFIAFAIGAVAATWGGYQGGGYARTCETRIVHAAVKE